MPKNKIEMRPLDLPRDGFGFMAKEGSFSKRIQSIIRMAEVKGFRIGWVAHTYDIDSMPLPDGKPYIVNITPFHMEPKPDPSLIEKQIKLCRNADCDFVVLSLHWGLEFELYPHPDQLKWAHRFAESGADMIVGHHPHVIQHMEIYKYVDLTIGTVWRKTIRTAPTNGNA